LLFDLFRFDCRGGVRSPGDMPIVAFRSNVEGGFPGFMVNKALFVDAAMVDVMGPTENLGRRAVL